MCTYHAYHHVYLKSAFLITHQINVRPLQSEQQSSLGISISPLFFSWERMSGWRLRWRRSRKKQKTVWVLWWEWRKWTKWLTSLRQISRSKFLWGGGSVGKSSTTQKKTNSTQKHCLYYININYYIKYISNSDEIQQQLLKYTFFLWWGWNGEVIF